MSSPQGRLPSGQFRSRRSGEGGRWGRLLFDRNKALLERIAVDPRAAPKANVTEGSATSECAEHRTFHCGLWGHGWDMVSAPIKTDPRTQPAPKDSRSRSF